MLVTVLGVLVCGKPSRNVKPKAMFAGAVDWLRKRQALLPGLRTGVAVPCTLGSPRELPTR